MTSFNPEHFLNRELSWLEFNQRVLDEALDAGNPLLERVKFLAIVSSNLDEFFEVRVAGLKQQIESEVVERSVDGMTASETMRAVTRRVRRMVKDLYACWRQELFPALARAGIRILDVKDLAPKDLAWVEKYYHAEVRPVLTPMAIDPAHPFPQLLNKSLNMIVKLEANQEGQRLQHLVVVQVPRVLSRFVKLPRRDSSQDYVMLGPLIGHFLGDLLPGTKILGFWAFRVTRNSELYIDEEETANLLKAVENELHNRRKGAAVRLEVQHDCPAPITSALLSTLRLDDEDLYRIDGPLNPAHLMALSSGDHSPELRDTPFVAPINSALKLRKDIFKAIRADDILLHHPYDSFESVVEFLQSAAKDDNVLAIKQTLYRTGGDARIIGALMEAVRNGKQVTAVVELRARFDEANNIQWARQLDEAGVQLVYGLVGYKIHCKTCLVVRREKKGIRRYVHLGTGNYNASTAKLYTDLGLFTCRPEFGEDATNLFNLLTGICQFQGMNYFLVAPFEMHARMLQLIEQEMENARQGVPARIIAKMNSLVDQAVIEALYRASQAGVTIDLIVRGICCLRPGVKGLSENITVRSIVDRFLEHSRIYMFENACRPVVYVASADWMPRNFIRRIEVAFPVEDGVLRDRIINEILPLHLKDNQKARVIQSNGQHRMVAPPKEKKKACRSQVAFMNLALKKAGEGKLAKSKSGKKSYLKVKLAPSPFKKK